MNKLLCLLPGLMIFYFTGPLSGQVCSRLDIRHLADIPSTCFQMTLTMKMDRLERPYLYVAAIEGGLKIYELSSPDKPVLISTLSGNILGGLHVMNLFQRDQLLFLALGNHFGNAGQAPGLAVVDVTNPAGPVVTDLWIFSGSGGGAGVVAVEGDYAYLGAMEHGLMIFKISGGNKLELVSRFVPDIRFPDANPDPAKYNARGIAVKDDIAYLCYDAGGIRIIDVSDKSAPKETGRFSNPALNKLPRAYNNVILDDSLLYAAVDYCGLEILNIADPAKIRLVSWWNPWNCQSTPLQWFSSPGHANELGFDEECRLLFLSTGKSDLHVLDVSLPASPDSCGFYGGLANETGTWGVDVFRGRIFLSYICAVIPFSSNWTGVKVLAYNNRCATRRQEIKAAPLSVFPNPAFGQLHISTGQMTGATEALKVYNLLGQDFALKSINRTGTELIIDISGLPPGVYVLRLEQDGQICTGKFLKSR